MTAANLWREGVYMCQYVYKYAVQDLHRKHVHVSSVPRHCIPSEISTAMRDGTETWLVHPKVHNLIITLKIH